MIGEEGRACCPTYLSRLHWLAKEGWPGDVEGWQSSEVTTRSQA